MPQVYIVDDAEMDAFAASSRILITQNAAVAA